MGIFNNSNAVSKNTIQVTDPKSKTEYSKKRMYIFMLLLGFTMYVVAVLPIIIHNGGLFFYYGDYNVQQVPFYILAHRAIRNGQLFWNFNIDLGGDLIADFAFYLFGSPFFWLTIPFPEDFLPYMMPFIMALKYAVASANGFLYMRRYSKTNKGAMLGALLFAFCGFNACNIVFNHFTDAVAFYPLLLMAFEELMKVDSKEEKMKLSGSKFIFYVVMISVCSIINYYFFFGQAIFIILYFILRYAYKTPWRVVARRFVRAILGAVLGIMISALFLFLAFNGVAGNSRLDNIILGYDMVVYSSAYMYWDILKSMVMLPDIIGRGTIFYTSAVKNASLAVYLPMFGLAGVISYFKMKKGKSDWKKRMLILSLIISFIPVLNSMFSLFNSQYYARWFYMPILIMSLVTMQSVEKDKGDNIKFGTLSTTLLFLLMVVIAILPSRDDDGNIVYMQMVSNKDMFWLDVLGTAIFSAMLIVIIFLAKNKKQRVSLAVCGTIIAGTFGTMITLTNGNSLISDYGMKMWKIQMLDTEPVLNSDEFCRVETDSTSTNYEMCWGLPTIHCFLSTVSSQIFDFYEGAAGITRSVESDAPLERAGLRALLSARYYIENTDINDSPEFSCDEGTIDYVEMAEDSNQNGFTIFENTNFIPMGFTFDYYTSESDWNACSASSLDYELVKVLILPDDVADALNDTDTSMIYLDADDLNDDEIDYKQFRSLCDKRADSSCESFSVTKNGFTATTKEFDEEELVFFSVPNASGMKATVDGKETTIITADYGLMAIPVTSGSHEIVVTYFPQNFGIGLTVSLFGIMLLIIYIVIYKKTNTNKEFFEQDIKAIKKEKLDNEISDNEEVSKEKYLNSESSDDNFLR